MKNGLPKEYKSFKGLRKESLRDNMTDIEVTLADLDEIAIICNQCKKVYGFNDVKYKPGCPKQL